MTPPAPALMTPGQRARRKRTLSVLCTVATAALALSLRLFSAVRHEPMINEHDPHFNYRATEYLVQHGWDGFLNWFDDKVWLPFGRHVGHTVRGTPSAFLGPHFIAVNGIPSHTSAQTLFSAAGISHSIPNTQVYPGLPALAAGIYSALASAGVPVTVRGVCVFLPPFMSVAASLACGSLAAEAAGEGAGLVASFLFAAAPGHVAKSTTGAFDLEGVAIFTMLSCLGRFAAAVRTGSPLHACAAALWYACMAASWGGYTYVANLLPLYCVVMALMGRYSVRLYAAFSVFYPLGTLLSMQVKPIHFQAVSTMEHLPALAVFAAMQCHALLCAADGLVSAALARGGGGAQLVQRWATLRVKAARWAGAALLLGVCALIASGWVSGWGARSLALLVPTYASKRAPLVSSVAEHQPPTWAHYYRDLGPLLALAPLGAHRACAAPSDAHVLLGLAALSSAYFSGVFVRMVLIFTPFACVYAAVGASYALQARSEDLQRPGPRDPAARGGMPPGVALLSIFGVGWLLWMFVEHGIWSSSELHGGPSSLIMRGRGGVEGADDLREAYRWMAHNLPGGSTVLSWWDYGYQIAALARGGGVGGGLRLAVDNNSWNHTQVAMAGAVLASPEGVGWRVMGAMGADYLLVVFGGQVGYGGDDLGKMLWPVRVAGAVFDGSVEVGGARPRVVEGDYLTDGEFRVGPDSPRALKESLLFKLSYHGFAKGAFPLEGKPQGWDLARGVSMRGVEAPLRYFDEVFTTENWLVRIYRRRERNRGDAEEQEGPGGAGGGDGVEGGG